MATIFLGATRFERGLMVRYAQASAFPLAAAREISLPFLAIIQWIDLLDSICPRPNFAFCKETATIWQNASEEEKAPTETDQLNLLKIIEIFFNTF
jgi:hypothetical protein